MMGSCLCKNVNVDLKEQKSKIGACYCSMCRKLTPGGWFYIWKPYPDGGFMINGGEWVGEYDSSDVASRGFCKNCGTNIFYKLKTGEYFFSSGLFEGAEFELVESYFEEQKPQGSVK